ncbi:MAG: KH domain-containing protein [bacterium]
MVNYENLIKSIVSPLIIFADDLRVDSSTDGDMLVLDIFVKQEDLGRVIGRNGKIAGAIRTLMYASSTKEGKKIRVNINSL